MSDVEWPRLAFITARSLRPAHTLRNSRKRCSTTRQKTASPGLISISSTTRRCGNRSLLGSQVLKKLIGLLINHHFWAGLKKKSFKTREDNQLFTDFFLHPWPKVSISDSEKCINSVDGQYWCCINADMIMMYLFSAYQGISRRAYTG